MDRKRSASVSSTEISHKQIEKLPQGDQISLPKLITSTTPGTVAGPFGQVFIRGNHANIQYQIDGFGKEHVAQYFAMTGFFKKAGFERVGEVEGH